MIPRGWTPPPVSEWDTLTTSEARRLHADLVALARHRDSLLSLDDGHVIRAQARAIAATLPPDPIPDILARRAIAVAATTTRRARGPR